MMIPQIRKTCICLAWIKLRICSSDNTVTVAVCVSIESQVHVFLQYTCTHTHSRSVQTLLNAEIYFKGFPSSLSHCMETWGTCSFISSKRVRPIFLQRVSPYLRAFLSISLAVSSCCKRRPPPKCPVEFLGFLAKPVNTGRSGGKNT